MESLAHNYCEISHQFTHASYLPQEFIFAQHVNYHVNFLLTVFKFDPTNSTEICVLFSSVTILINNPFIASSSPYPYMPACLSVFLVLCYLQCFKSSVLSTNIRTNCMYGENVRNNLIINDFHANIFYPKQVFLFLINILLCRPHALWKSKEIFLIFLSSQASNNVLILLWRFNSDIYDLINVFALFY